MSAADNGILTHVQQPVSHTVSVLCTPCLQWLSHPRATDHELPGVCVAFVDDRIFQPCTIVGKSHCLLVVRALLMTAFSSSCNRQYVTRPLHYVPTTNDSFFTLVQQTVSRTAYAPAADDDRLTLAQQDVNRTASPLRAYC
jgi:hypothetical protein